MIATASGLVMPLTVISSSTLAPRMPSKTCPLVVQPPLELDDRGRPVLLVIEHLPLEDVPEGVDGRDRLGDPALAIGT